jgi:hypothetical protein
MDEGLFLMAVTHGTQVRSIQESRGESNDHTMRMASRLKKRRQTQTLMTNSIAELILTSSGLALVQKINGWKQTSS